MKVWQLCFIFFITILYTNSSNLINNKNQDLNEINSINTFLQTGIKVNQSYDLFINRIAKMRKKKEIIIKNIYEMTPIVGEILALANVEKINLIVNRFFITRERDLLRKYIIMWDVNSNSISQSAKVLLNLLLCNNQFNRLRCILNLLMEGLCAGEKRDFQIFKEIVITVIIDTLLKTKFYYYNDLQAKFNLIRIFNKSFKFKPINKIQFVEKMMISDKLKEILTFIIMRLKTNDEIEIEMDFVIHKTPALLANNTRLFEFKPSFPQEQTPEQKKNTLINEIEKSQKENQKILSKSEAKRILDNLKTYSDYNYNQNSFSFKEKLLLQNLEKESTYSEVDLLDPNNLEMPKSQKIKLSEIKEEMKNEYTDFLYNQTTFTMPSLEEIQPFYQIGVERRTIYPKYKKHISNLIKLNELLDEFPPNTPKGSVDVVNTPIITKKDIKTIITKQIAPGVKYSMQFKEKSNNEIKNTVQQSLQSQPPKLNKISQLPEFKDLFRFKSSLSLSSTTKEDDFADRSFQMLTMASARKSINQNKINNKPSDINEDNNSQAVKVDPNFNDNEINQHIINNSSKDIQELISNKNIKVLFPKEIHTTYQVNKKGMKNIEVNKNSKNKF